MDNNLVEINGLHFQRNGRPIFDGIDLVIPRGKVVAIMGPSGTGKTTLLRLIGGQLQPLKAVSMSRVKIYIACRSPNYSDCEKKWACCFRAVVCLRI